MTKFLRKRRRPMKAMLLAALASITLAGPSWAEETPPSTEASIPFVNHGGIRDWRDSGRDAIYVQDQHRLWYRGTFIGPCTDLPFTEAIGFETRGPDTFDRFGSLKGRGPRRELSSSVKRASPIQTATGREECRGKR